LFQTQAYSVCEPPTGTDQVVIANPESEYGPCEASQTVVEVLLSEASRLAPVEIVTLPLLLIESVVAAYATYAKRTTAMSNIVPLRILNFPSVRSIFI
jgi:hypothetical protein